MRSHTLIHNLRLIASFALVGSACFGVMGGWAVEGELLRIVGAALGAIGGLVFAGSASTR